MIIQFLATCIVLADLTLFVFFWSSRKCHLFLQKWFTMPFKQEYETTLYNYKLSTSFSLPWFAGCFECE